MTAAFGERYYSQKLDEWRRYRPSLFGGNLNPATDDQLQRHLAIYRHLMRNLSRGRIPPVEPVEETLNGAPIPPCGHIGCKWEEEHVH